MAQDFDSRYHEVTCPSCGDVVIAVGLGIDGAYQCLTCGEWTNLFGQHIINPRSQEGDPDETD